ncbi:MAG TPA: GNAT family protein [Rhodanobacteraceae bacterium]
MPNLPLQAVSLQDTRITLEPLALEHVPALERAATDGELWKLWFTSVPAPGRMAAYVEAALRGQMEGHMLPFAVRERASNEVVGCTRFCDYDPAVPRVEIGYTWYAQRWQRSHVNTHCKHLLLDYAFEALGCASVVLCTDRYNVASQRAIERLGAQRDGVLRAHRRRPDGTLRDTVIYSITANDWPDVQRLLAMKMDR